MKKEKDDITSNIKELQSSSNEDLWLKEIELVKQEYQKIYNNKEDKELSIIKVKKRK